MAKPRPKPRPGLRNIDRTDREMLMVMEAAMVTDPRGRRYARSEDIAAELGITSSQNRSPAGRVSVRLAWMKRVGQVARLDGREVGLKKSDACWIITPLGEQILRGRLTKQIESKLVNSNAGENVLIMRELMRNGFVTARFDAAQSLRRQMMHDLAQRPRDRY